MYSPSAFSVTDPDTLTEFVRRYPLGTLTANGTDGAPVATLVPFLPRRTERGVALRCHVMKKSDHWEALVRVERALAVFSGPNCFV